MNDNNLCNEVCKDFLPAFRKLAGTDVYSITLAGSHGKGIADKSSDFDFCLYYEKPAKMADRHIAYKEIEKLIANWKERLSTYPEALKDSIIKKHVTSLEYWRNDYHYKNKAQRKDAVFLASITTRLVHDMMQVIYALNEFYYPGDGMNLKYTEQFKLKPENFEARVTDIFRISDADDTYEVQYEKLTGLIDEVLELTR